MGEIYLPNAMQFDQMNELLAKIANTGMRIDYTDSPGGKYLLAGDEQAGFLGFVQHYDFGKIEDNPEGSQDFDGKNLALAIGLSDGTPINIDTAWIKYIYKGKICYTPIKPLRHTMSWNAIYESGAVYGVDNEGMLPPNGRLGVDLSINGSDNSINCTNQNFLGNKSSDMDYADTVAAVGDTVVLKGWENETNNGEFTVEFITNTKIILSGGTLVTEEGGKTSRVYEKTKAVKQNTIITLDGIKFRVRLMTGAGTDPVDSYDNADRGAVGPNNEWNSIILPLHEHAKLGNWNYPAYAKDKDGNAIPDWGVYLTDEDLVTYYTFGYGNYRWCQNVIDNTTWRRVFRGYYGASGLFRNYSWGRDVRCGWAPVLERIS